MNISEVIQKFKNLSPARKNLLSEVIKVVKLMLVIPATNAISERSFSSNKRVKTYLRATMKDNRLNHLMTLHVHKCRTDELNLISLDNTFISKNDERRNLFGEFRENDAQMTLPVKDAGTQTA